MVSCRILVVAVALLGCSSALQLFRRPSSSRPSLEVGIGPGGQPVVLAKRQKPSRPSLEVGIGPGGRPVVLAKRQSPERLDHDDDNFVFIGGRGGHSNPIISSVGGGGGGFHDSIHSVADVGFHPQEPQPLDFHHNDQSSFHQSPPPAPAPRRNNFHQSPAPSAPRRNNFHQSPAPAAPRRNSFHQKQPHQGSFSRGGGRNVATGSRAFGALFSGRDEFVPRRQQSGFHERRRQESTASHGFDRHQQSSSTGFHQQPSTQSSNGRFSHDSGHDDRFAPVSRPSSIKIPGLPIRLVVSRVSRRH